MICSIAECDKPSWSRGWCTGHYTRWRRHGNPLAYNRIRRPSEEIFNSRMGIPPEEGCWDWTGGVQSSGYGHFTLVREDGKKFQMLAHRASQEIFNGPIPDGLYVLHSCDRKICVQPKHLRVGTQAENLREARERGLM